MSDLLVLRRAVLERPAGDGPRRAYAAGAGPDDGTPAGEFAQDIGGLTAAVPGQQAAVGRLARAAWRAGYTARAGWTGGFIHRVELPAAAFLAHAADLFAAHPVTTIRLTDRHPELCPDGAGVRWVERPAGRSAPLRGRHRRAGPGPDLPPEFFAAGLPRTPFATVALADAGLAAARVLHGRRLAGLDPGS
jgi:hypothetical protein